MTQELIITLLLAVLAAAAAARILLSERKQNLEMQDGKEIGISQTTGRKEVQADVVHGFVSHAGMMGVLADGIGRENTGKMCAQLAVDTILDQFESYRILNNPQYFFKSAFLEANSRIQKTIGERRGGASIAAVFVDGKYLYYAVAGNVRTALVRNKELIPLSRGQTLDVLAAQAYHAGKISRQEAVWSMEEKRLWNYLGRDGFREIEICEQPVLLKNGDYILVISKGIFEELSWGEIEDILQETENAQWLADQIVCAAEAKSSPDMDNGSVLLLSVKTEAADETNQL